MSRPAHALQPASEHSQRRPAPEPRAPPTSGFEEEEGPEPTDAWTEIAMILAGMLRRQEDWEAHEREVLGPEPQPGPPQASDEADTISDETPTALDTRDPEAPPKYEPRDGPENDATRFLTGREPPTRVPPLEAPKGDAKPADKETPELDAAPPPEPTLAAPTTEAPPPPEAPPKGGGPRAMVRRWQGGVSSGGGGMPKPKVEAPPGAKAGVEDAKGAVEKRNRAAREGMTADALAATPKPPVVEDPPAPPPSNPVPDHTKAILDLSGKRLASEVLPGMVTSPERTVEGEKIAPEAPKVGDKAVRPDLFQLLTTPGAEKLAGDPVNQVGKDNKPTKEALAVKTALDRLAPKKEDGEKEAPPGKGEPVTLEDKGPEPMDPVPKDMEIPVGQVVARLLSQADQTVSGVLDTLRTSAYPKGVLKKEFPDIGSDMSGELKSQVDTELRDIAAAANVSAEQLQGMIAERQQLLAGTSTTAKADAKATGEAAVTSATEEGQKTMDSVAGAAVAAEEQTVRRQEAAGGDSDPTIINRRRDLTVAWIREQVTTQITNYQNAGDKRVGELTAAQRGQSEAYSAMSQRHQYKVLKPEPPRKPREEPLDPTREKLLADIVAEIRFWTDERVKELGEYFRKRIKATNDTTRDNRKAIQSAGTSGIEAARAWAEDKILAGQSWWKRIMARIKRWLTEADSLNEDWKVRRTRENRDAVVRDLQLVQAAEKALKDGVTKEQLLATEGLSAGQKAVLEQYFSKAGTTPLEFAATRLQTTIALDHLEQVQPKFEAALIAMPVSYGDYGTVEKINQVAMSTGGGFDGAKAAQECRGAMDQIGTDEPRIFAALKGLTGLRGAVVRKFYRVIYDRDLDYDLEDEMSGDELGRAQAQIEGKEAKADAIALHDAVAGLGTDEKAIMDLLRNKSPEEVEAIKAEYLSKYGETLDAALEDDLDEGNEIDQARALMSGDTATADAIALDEAMRGGITGWGTDEDEIEKIYKRVHDEVLARAKAENWTSAQMEAEIRRRLGKIEGKFEDRYKNVAQYNEPGATGSTLKRAFKSELSGPEFDLAAALQDNDYTRADAARIEIERQSAFYASDEKLNGVLRSQYERALEGRRLDEGPARQMVINREVQKLREAKPPMSEEDISKVRMRMEREMEAAIDVGAQKDSKASMEALTEVYQKNYHPSLAYVLAFNMSGTDAEAAQLLLKQGGKLTALQEVDLATKQVGTDEEALRRRLSKMTKKEIQQLREDWEKLHPNESFDDMLRSELSGRDESDVMDMVQHGAPESALGQIEQERRRVERERYELTGVLGGAAAGKEEAWMQHQYDQLAELKADLNRTDWPDTEEGRRKREELMEKVDFRVQRVQDAVADHRRRIDSYTDTATQIVGIVVGVAVAIILGAISGGTLGVATIALMASLYATTATMLTKALIKGGAYGGEEMGIDIAVGAVDALTAVATAGMGSKLLGPMKNFVSKTKIGNVASWIGKSGLVQKAVQAPVVGRAATFAGKFLPSRAALERGAAKFLAEGAEDAISSVPSTFTQLALTDTTWEGDPLMNFLEGGGMSLIQAVAMGRMLGAGMDLGTAAFTAGRGHFRMQTEVGRLMEAQRILADSYAIFREDNPHASPGDFLSHPEGRKARQQIEEKGLLPTIESVNRQIKADAELRAKAEEADPANPAPPVSKAEARARELASGVPPSAREGTFVTPDPGLTGNAVRVEPLKIGGRIVGVDVRVGPDATPLDIALHGATVHAMQKYRGVLGEVRRKLENAAAIISGSGLHVGSAGWEARFEMAKLPAIIASRMEGLAGRALTPDIEAAVLADVASLDRQFQHHTTVFYTAALRGAEGRGYIAAEDAGKVDPEALKALQRAIEDSVRSGDVEAARKLADDLAAQSGLTRGQVLDLAAPMPKELKPTKDLSAAEAQAMAKQRQELAAEKAHAERELLISMSFRQLEREIQAAMETSQMADAVMLADELARQLGVSRESFVRGLGPTPREFADAFAPDRMLNVTDPTRMRDEAKVRDRMLRALESEVRQQRVLAEFASRLEGSPEDVAGRVFDDMINWIILSERKKVEQADLRRQQEAAGTAPQPGPSAPKPKRPKVDESAGMREQEFKYERPGSKERPLGRFPSSKELVHSLRGTEIAGLDLRGFLLKSTVEENVAAIRQLQDHVRSLNPDMVLGVKKGGMLMMHLLAGTAGALPENFVVVEKGALRPDEIDLKEEHRTWIQRTRELQRVIQEAIDQGKRTFVIADFYMGGLAASQFRDMCYNIIQDNPNVTGLHFETVWLREHYGFERNTLDTTGTALAHGGVERARQVPEKMQPKPATATEPARPGVHMEVVGVRYVIGDDMEFALSDDPAVLASPDSKRPIKIFDSDGRVVKEIKVGDKDPVTQNILTSSREIIIALMLGHFQ